MVIEQKTPTVQLTNITAFRKKKKKSKKTPTY